MNKILDTIRSEPVAIGGLVTAVIAVATAFGLQWSADQIGAVTALASIVTALIARGQSTPTVNIPEPPVIVVPPAS